MVFTNIDYDDSDVVEESGEFENWDDVKNEIALELAQSKSERQALKKRIQQSQVEVDKLAQRNAAINAQVQRLHIKTESISTDDLIVAHNTALEGQQRLFVTRGQVDKLQNDYDSLGRYIDLLSRVGRILEQGFSIIPGSAGSFATIEMMIQAQEDERQRLSRQMHDGPAQSLSNFIIQTEIASRLFDINPEQAREELSMLKQSAATTFQKVREFIFELRPMMLDDLGLVPTVRRYVEAVQETSNLDVQVIVSGSEARLENYLEVVLFRAIQELLKNAVTHSQGTELSVQMDITENQVQVSVEDNGKGYDPTVTKDPKNMGLKLIKERVELLGGGLNIDSVPGQGTRISFYTPIHNISD